MVSERGTRTLVDHTKAVPHLYDYFVPSSMAAEVARTAGAQGPVALVSTGCTSGLDAIGHAVDLVREGSADVMVTGAAEAPITPITAACFDAIRATSTRNDEPETASRPFDRTRNGFVLGRARPSSSSRSTSTPAPAARTCTPRSRVSPRAATPTT